MPEPRRITSTVKTASGLVVSQKCLLYGLLLASKGGLGGASAVACDSATSVAVALSTRVLPIYRGSPTGTETALLPFPRVMDNGIFLTMGGTKAHVVVFYTNRD